MTVPAEPHISGGAAHAHRAVAQPSPESALSILGLSALGRLVGVAVVLAGLWGGAWWAMH